MESVIEAPASRQSFLPLAAVVSPLYCSRVPSQARASIGPERLTSEACQILESRDLRSFRFVLREQWAEYASIQDAFRRPRKNHISLLPESLVAAPVKLVLRDRSRELKCTITAERIYPVRAWMGALAPGWDVEMGFAVCGILNSTVGRILYTRVAAELGSGGTDLAKAVLDRLPIPTPSSSPEAFAKLAQLSYRLHQLYAAQAECSLDLAVAIRDHWLYLLPLVVNLYGWSEREARELLQQVPHSRDYPGGQEELFAGWPQSPIRPLRLLKEPEIDRYEGLKGRARAGQLTPDEAPELTRLKDTLAWEEKVNAPVPARLPQTRWPGIATPQEATRAAYAYLARTRGQRFSVATPERTPKRSWVVPTFYAGRSGSQREQASTLYVDAVTGEVTETLERAHQHGVAACAG
jgi:hypothetical protein